MKNLGIYVHIPFCKKKCEYCDFVSFSNENEYQEKYIECLCKEIGRTTVEQYKINTIYFGGGTPSYIESELIVKVLDKIKSKYKISKTVEITIEVNPRYN